MPLIGGDELDYFDILERMLPQFDRYFFYCRWLSRFGECEKFFRKTLTEEGICFTFNGLRATEIYREDTYQYQHCGDALEMENTSSSHAPWTLETGYAHLSDVETFPARVLSAGARSGIFLALQSFKQEVDYACRGPVQGFKVGHRVVCDSNYKYKYEFHSKSINLLTVLVLTIFYVDKCYSNEQKKILAR